MDWLYNLKVDDKTRSCPLFCRWGQIDRCNLTEQSKLLIDVFWYAESKSGLFSESIEIIPSKTNISELFNVMEQQDVLPSREFHVGNETKIDKLNMNIRNQLELQLV